MIKNRIKLKGEAKETAECIFVLTYAFLFIAVMGIICIPYMGGKITSVAEAMVH